MNVDTSNSISNSDSSVHLSRQATSDIDDLIKQHSLPRIITPVHSVNFNLTTHTGSRKYLQKGNDSTHSLLLECTKPPIDHEPKKVSRSSSLKKLISSEACGVLKHVAADCNQSEDETENKLNEFGGRSTYSNAFCDNLKNCRYSSSNTVHNSVSVMGKNMTKVLQTTDDYRHSVSNPTDEALGIHTTNSHSFNPKNDTLNRNYESYETSNSQLNNFLCNDGAMNAKYSSEKDVHSHNDESVYQSENNGIAFHKTPSEKELGFQYAHKIHPAMTLQGVHISSPFLTWADFDPAFDNMYRYNIELLKFNKTMSSRFTEIQREGPLQIEEVKHGNTRQSANTSTIDCDEMYHANTGKTGCADSSKAMDENDKNQVINHTENENSSLTKSDSYSAYIQPPSLSASFIIENEIASVDSNANLSTSRSTFASSQGGDVQPLLSSEHLSQEDVIADGGNKTNNASPSACSFNSDSTQSEGVPLLSGGNAPFNATLSTSIIGSDSNHCEGDLPSSSCTSLMMKNTIIAAESENCTTTDSTSSVVSSQCERIQLAPKTVPFQMKKLMSGGRKKANSSDSSSSCSSSRCEDLQSLSPCMSMENFIHAGCSNSSISAGSINSCSVQCEDMQQSSSSKLLPMENMITVRCNSVSQSVSQGFDQFPQIKPAISTPEKNYANSLHRSLGFISNQSDNGQTSLSGEAVHGNANIKEGANNASASNSSAISTSSQFEDEQRFSFGEPLRMEYMATQWRNVEHAYNTRSSFVSRSSSVISQHNESQTYLTGGQMPTEKVAKKPVLFNSSSTSKCDDVQPCTSDAAMSMDDLTNGSGDESNPSVSISSSNSSQCGGVQSSVSYRPPPIEVMITLDTTGSMSYFLDEVKSQINEIINRLFSDIPNLKIGLIAHGDYCDEDVFYLTHQMDMTNDIQALCKMVYAVDGTGGGDFPECYELILRQVRLMSWSPGSQRVVIMIGDARPHTLDELRKMNKEEIDWKVEAAALKKELGVRVYGVQCQNHDEAGRFWYDLAAITTGQHLILQNFHSIVDTIMAICYSESGRQNLKAYEEEVRMRDGPFLAEDINNTFSLLGQRARRGGADESAHQEADTMDEDIRGGGANESTHKEADKMDGDNYHNSDSDSDDNEHTSEKHVHFSNQKDVVYIKNIKTIQREMARANKRRIAKAAAVTKAKREKKLIKNLKSKIQRKKRERITNHEFIAKHLSWSPWIRIITSSKPTRNMTTRDGHVGYILHRNRAKFNDGRSHRPVMFEVSIQTSLKSRHLVTYCCIMHRLEEGKDWFDTVFTRRINKKVDYVLNQRTGINICVRRLLLHGNNKLCRKYTNSSQMASNFRVAIQGRYEYIWGKQSKRHVVKNGISFVEA